ncbi:DUF6415 family natural product biosynthesis protein [Streptomyces sp. NBC_01456]|uniref:DUF6415 family natural product biosynthesis protein n=1 Tax=unclassified Streptomyces TaxID=2593676 RepID=UPI002E356E0E|nr:MULTISPECIES: DUF6415 family natural product biosynthesis protein [unclassified Streptomyces]
MTTQAGQREPRESTGVEPIDTDTIRETVRLGLLLSAGPLDRDAMTALHEALRGHVALLLPIARGDADRLWRGGTAWYQRAARLDGIARQAEQPLPVDPFAALVQVQLLARDCEWLLGQSVARADS